ncbi:MAG: ribosome biogenesis GTPase Der [Clostridia bacterium]|nr:ribosome biogenesis GTPase Der [Clostridia bacterium]
MKPIVAIVGRPNVGKSTLFNKITGKRISIVEDVPGVTRDRIYFDANWNGRDMLLVDTGGIEPKTGDTILKHMRMQAQIAIDTADVIIFMCDIRAGLTADDMDIATLLLRSRKPVIPCVNKIDKVGNPPPEFYEFYAMGFAEDPIPLSSLHGTGSGDLLDRVVSYFPAEERSSEEEGHAIQVAVIGKPNAGKSSLINHILGEDRLIVSDIAGTTRDAIDSRVENKYGLYNFIDTAGIRRQSKVDDKIERYSVMRAKLAIERSEVCILMIDASVGITEQDEHIAGLAHEAGKAMLICVNKWDLIEKDNSSVKQFTDKIRTSLSYMPYASLMFISAKTGQRVDRIFETVNQIYSEANKRITTGVLNDLLSDCTAKVQPPSDKGRRLKIYYMTQNSVAPPTFVIFCNDAGLFHFSYQRYIENQLREVFGFEGTPIKLIIRERGEKPVD